MCTSRARGKIGKNKRKNKIKFNKKWIATKQSDVIIVITAGIKLTRTKSNQIKSNQIYTQTGYAKLIYFIQDIKSTVVKFVKKKDAISYHYGLDRGIENVMAVALQGIFATKVKQTNSSKYDAMAL